jgi:sarcosine oxidase subunit beta
MAGMYDTVVIGGGVVGCAVAYFLSASGQNVAILERGTLTSGTSGKCDGNLQIGDSKAGFATEFMKSSLRMFPEVVRTFGIDVEYEKNGSLFVFETEAEIEAGKALVEAKRASGFNAELLDRCGVHECEMRLAPDILGGIFIGDDAQINPMRLTIALAECAKKWGTKIFKRTEVTDIGKCCGCLSVYSGEEVFKARNVVNAAGVWAPDIGRMLGINVPIIPRQGHLLVTEPTECFVSRTVTEFGYIMTKYEGNNYRRNTTAVMEEYGVATLLEPTKSGTMLIGSSRRFVGYKEYANHKVVNAMASRAMRFFPSLRQLGIMRFYAGMRPYTADQRPIISATPVEGFYLAAGHEGSGIALSLITGKMIDEIISKKELSFPPDVFSLSRFEGKAGS